MDKGYIPTRVRYFGGMYLCTGDFQTEQTYHRYARELLNSGIFTPGIVEGLTVNIVREAHPVQAIVSPGRALDDSGRLLVLVEDVQVDLSSVEDGPSYSIIIKYKEVDEEVARTVEMPSVELVHRSPVKGEVLLASLSMEGGDITVSFAWGSQAMRRHAGAVLGSIEFPVESASVPQPLLLPDPTPISIAARGYAKGNSPVLEITAPNIALHGDDSVIVDGKLAVEASADVKGVLTAHGTVEIEGLLTAEHGLSVTGGVTADSLTVTGTSTLSGDTTTSGSLSAKGGLIVAEGATTDSLTVTGASALDGTTTTSGSLSANGGLTVANGATADSLKVTGESTLSGTTIASGSLSANGGLIVAKGATTDTLTVTGATALEGTTTASGTFTAEGGLSVTGAATVTGNLTANKFIGDGSALTNLPSNSPSSIWQNSGKNIYYNGGNVGVGDNDPSSLLTVKGGTGSQIGSGLVTLGAASGDGYTLIGYQTSFQKEIGGVDKKYVLAFGSVQQQEVEIASVAEDRKTLTLKAPFPLSVGWCVFKYRHAGGDVQCPNSSSRFLAEGLTVKSHGADFSLVRPGDMLVIASFVSQSADQWQVSSVTDDFTATVKNLTSPGTGSAPPNASAFAIATSSYAVTVTGGAAFDNITLSDTKKTGLTVAGTASISNLTVMGSGTALTVNANAEVKGALTIGGGITGLTVGYGDFITVPGGPFSIARNAPNWGDLLSGENAFSVPSDGIFILNSSGGYNCEDGYSFRFTFWVKVSSNGSTVTYSSEASEMSANAGHTLSSAFICLPVCAGESITVAYGGGGSNNLKQAIDFNISFRPLQLK